MKLIRNLAFLLIVGAALYGHGEALQAADCPVYIGGAGSCTDMESEIVNIIWPYNGETCLDYCDWLMDECLSQEPPQGPPYCYVNDEYCSFSPYDEWHCECLCYYPSPR